jgi:Zn-dependent metalloprotease
MCTKCFLVPPLVLSRIAANHPDAAARASAKRTLTQDRKLRAARTNAHLLAASHHTGTTAPNAPAPSTPNALTPHKLSPQRTIYTAQQRNDLQASERLRTESSPPAADPSANAAYDTLGIAYQYFATVHNRDSLDGLGAPLNGIIHFADNYANAFWDGNGHMIFGDGDNQIIRTDSLVSAIDVVTHELTHAVTQSTYQLNYSAQAGALNEHISDVFGTLARQWHHQIPANEDHWLIGHDITGTALAFPDHQPSALRSMLHPGTANPYDQQPDHMTTYYRGTADHRGVHENSGIPNRAFALAAIELGGNAWETLGPIWYQALTTNHHPTARFTTFANNTITATTQLHGPNHHTTTALRNAWTTVGIL